VVDESVFDLPDGELKRVFDLSIGKILVLAVIALIIFGPNELPKMASQAGKALRDLRRIAEGAKNDLREGLGPEFADFELEDLHPKRFVQKHFLDDLNGDSAKAAAQPTRSAQAKTTLLAPGERPPFDTDAT
jgi:sec-independent protein translocase protein TatB